MSSFFGFRKSAEQPAKGDSKTLSETIQNFQGAVEKVSNEIATKSLPLQKGGFECCCECFTKHPDDVHKIADCLRECQRPAEVFNKKLEGEMQTLQNSLKSCQQVCYTKYSGQFDKAGDSDRQAVDEKHQACVADCFTNHLPQLNDMRERLILQMK